MKKMESLLALLETSIGKTLVQVREEAVRMDESSRAGTGGKIATIQQCEVPLRIQHGSDISSFVPTKVSYIKPPWITCSRLAREELQAARESLDALHALNEPLLVNNVQVAAQVKLIMANLGIPESRSTYGFATQRARKMSTTTVTAGFVGDLAAVCKTSDNFDACKRRLDDFERRIEKYENDERLKATQAERKESDAQAERAKLTLLGALAHKYDCEPEYDAVIDRMSQLDRYFGLAYHLERNRNNWNDGPSHALQGLDGFTVVTEEDHLIVADLRERTDNWDGDGRTFQGSPYGIDFLYGKVAVAGMLADLDKLRNAGLMPSD